MLKWGEGLERREWGAKRMRVNGGGTGVVENGGEETGN